MLTPFDWTKLLLSLLIASVSAFVAFEALGQTEKSKHPTMWTWLAGCTFGAGIWSTHFYSLLGWHPGFRRYYDARFVVVSIVVAVASSWFALWLTGRQRETVRGWAIIASTLILGSGIDAMHILGMAALHLTPRATWNPTFLLASLATASGVSFIGFALLRRGTDVGWRLSGAVTLGAAICLAHSLGMQAMMLSKGAHSVEAVMSLSGPVLARTGISSMIVFTFGLLILSYHQSNQWMQIAHEARREADEATRQAERLATAGKIAASIAHEINNPLEAVTNLLYLVQSEDESTLRQQYLTQAQNEIGRISEITTHTLKFYRQQSSPELVQVGALFDTAIALFQGRILRRNIRVQRIWQTDLEPILCRSGEVRQVLANLVSNAIDAMPEGGDLRLRLRERDGHLLIEVADTGCGISQETKKQIFEPFFTTKGVGGTGLGLSISADIIARHGGQISISSSTTAEDHGTQIRITLPYIHQQTQTTFAYEALHAGATLRPFPTV